MIVTTTHKIEGRQVAQYLGPERARESFETFATTHRISLEPAAPAEFELLQHAEHLLHADDGKIVLLICRYPMPPPQDSFNLLSYPINRISAGYLNRD